MSLLGRWQIVASPRTGADELDHAQAGAWPQLQPGGSLNGPICLHPHGDANFIARQETSSTAC